MGLLRNCICHKGYTNYEIDGYMYANCYSREKIRQFLLNVDMLSSMLNMSMSMMALRYPGRLMQHVLNTEAM